MDIDNEKNAVKIHFEGWSNRYDEVLFNKILINSNEKVKPLTFLYSG
jgi:hypothetical protein